MSDEAKTVTDVSAPEVSNCDAPDVFEPHEPPIGLSGGSFDMQVPDNIRESQLVPADSRPYKYVLRDEAYGPLSIVRAITELDDGKFNFTRYVVPAAMGCKLLIWIHQLKEIPTTGLPFEYEPRRFEPQITIKGGPFLLETDRQLQGSTETFKFHRRFAYKHPGYQRQFRIAGWAIVDSNNSLVHENNDPTKREFQAFDQDGLKLYVSFHHHQ